LGSLRGDYNAIIKALSHARHAPEAQLASSGNTSPTLIGLEDFDDADRSAVTFSAASRHLYLKRAQGAICKAGAHCQTGKKT
jgi:hypothetical protein